MEIFIGVDLGSTTTKTVLLDDAGQVVGRGITNSRSNYEVASRVARREAFVQARFNLTREALRRDPVLAEGEQTYLAALGRAFRLRHHLDQLARLRTALHQAADTPRHAGHRRELDALLDRVVDEMEGRAGGHFSALSGRKSDFFRDLATADYMHLAERLGDPKGITFEVLSGLYDKAILPVENSSSEAPVERQIAEALDAALDGSTPGAGAVTAHASRLRAAMDAARAIELEEVAAVGTGYGRARLPFPKEQIRSEILCHGLGAHTLFPRTRTVLDIGGQDTKAIQVDDQGIVTSFQMNDRCAAGCGRYLGYIADELNLGVYELGLLV